MVGAEAGRCAAQWVIDAVELAMADRIDAIVTAPLNKEAMHMGGFKYNGHTELLAKYSGATTSRLMLVANNLKVVHATCHVAFRNVSEQVGSPSTRSRDSPAPHPHPTLFSRFPRASTGAVSPNPAVWSLIMMRVPTLPGPPHPWHGSSRRAAVQTWPPGDDG